MCVSSFYSTFVQKVSLSIKYLFSFVKDQLAICIQVYFWPLYSISLIQLSILSPILSYFCFLFKREKNITCKSTTYLSTVDLQCCVSFRCTESAYYFDYRSFVLTLEITYFQSYEFVLTQGCVSCSFFLFHMQFRMQYSLLVSKKCWSFD